MPELIEQTGLSTAFLADLALKIVSSDSECTSERMAESLKLPMGISENLMQHLYREKYIDIRERSGVQRNRYAMLDRGWDRVQRLLSLNGYIGPAPITLEDYSAGIRWMHQHTGSYRSGKCQPMPIRTWSYPNNSLRRLASLWIPAAVFS